MSEAVQSISFQRTGPKTIVLTEAAQEKVAELLKKEGDLTMALRVGVKPGGCSGFSYEMFFDSDRSDEDIVTTYDNGVNVVVDPQSSEKLVGATLDYKDGLNEAGFAINNPNVSKTCGCGNSFS